jgi:hypothetical protein
MKMLAEYFDTATRFEQMAAQENDPKLKVEFENKPPLIASSRNESQGIRPQDAASKIRNVPFRKFTQRVP